MQIETRFPRVAVAVVFAACASLFLAPADVQAEKKSKRIQTEARWVGFDAEAKQVTVKVTKAGKIRDKKMKKEFKTGKEVTFDVKPEGSVLTRTTVAFNGQKGEITDIQEGKQVNIYWEPDEAKKTGKMAWKIDVVFSEEEWNEKYGFDD